MSYGKQSWEDSSFGGNKEGKTSNKDLFLKLKDGSNIVRIVTDPYQYIVHKSIKREGDPGFGRKIPCSKSETETNCPLCELGSQPASRYYFGVIDRSTNSYKVLDVSWSTLQDIKGFVNQKIWGDVTKYDLNILKDPKHPTKYYTIQANPHTPLSPSDQKLRDDADLADLEFKSSPMSPELVKKIMDKALAGGALALPPPKEGQKAKVVVSKPVVAKKTAPAVDVSSNDDDVSDIFPDYDQQPEAATA